MFDAFKSVAKEAVLLNIRYYSSLVDLQQKYLMSLNSLVQGANVQESPAKTQDKREGTPVMAPLVLSGKLGEKAEAVFSIHNHLNRKVIAEVKVSGDLPLDKIKISPEDKTLDCGEEAIFTISYIIDEELKIEKDRHGVVTVPELSRHSIPVVLRRVGEK